MSEKPLTKKWKVGQQVTCKREVEPYNKRDWPEFGNFKPGMVGTVGAIPPPVTGRRRYFLAVDYDDPNQPGRTLRCALWPDNVKAVKS